MLLKEVEVRLGRYRALAALVGLFQCQLGTMCSGVASLISANADDKAFMRSKTESFTL